MNKSLAKIERLSTPRDIARVRASKLCQFGDGVALKWRNKNPSGNFSNVTPKCRLGIIVRKKAVRSAVKRNRMKRLSREYFRLNKNKFKRNADMIIFVNRYKSLKYKDFESILNAVFKRAGLL